MAKEAGAPFCIIFGSDELCAFLKGARHHMRMVLARVIGEILGALCPCSAKDTILLQECTHFPMLIDGIPLAVYGCVQQGLSPIMVEEVLALFLGHAGVLHHPHFWERSIGKVLAGIKIGVHVEGMPSMECLVTAIALRCI